LTQQNSFGDETDARPWRRNIFEADLVAHFFTEPAIALGSDPSGEETRGEAARLENHDLALSEQAVIEEDLGDLGGFSGAGGSLDDDAGMGAEIFYDRSFEFKDR
jgi:hypothetical protein